MKTACTFALALIGLLVAAVASRPAGVSATVAAADEPKEVERRLEALERVVLTDPYQQKRTLVARMTAAEDAIEDLEERAATAAGGRDKDEDALRRALADLDKETEAIGRRLKSAEDELRKRGEGGGSGDLGDLKRKLAELDRSVKDLNDRVKRLEAKQ